MKIINKKSITIYSLVVLVFSIVSFEILYCNTSFFKGLFQGEIIQYNFSLCRIIFYIISIILYIVFKNKFIENSLLTCEYKIKRILIYFTAIIAMVYAFITIVVCVQNRDTSLIRTLSITLITAQMASLFVIYISNDVCKNVIVTATTFGIVFAITTNFNHAIDEKKHFMTALNISFLNFDYKTNPITDKKIEELPQLSKYTEIDSFLENNYKEEVTNEVNMQDEPSTPATYSAITYIFPGTGIAIARLLGGSIIDMYILGRIINLIIYTILVYIAIKLLPFKKNIFFIVAFMPYMLLLAASYSIDGICLGTLYIFCAYCFKLYKENKTISLKQFIILGFLFVIMLFGKGLGYLGVGVIVFILPLINTIRKNKKYIPIMIICSIVFILLATIFVIYMKNSAITDGGDSRGGEGINGKEQLNVILTHPIFDMKLAIQHIKATLMNFDWLTDLHQKTFFTNTSMQTTFLMMLFILYVAITEDDFLFNRKDKYVNIMAFLLSYAFTSIILYISFTPVGVLYIAGYQARYIFPILPLVLSCIANNKVQYRGTENRIFNVALGTGVFLLIGLIQLILV